MQVAIAIFTTLGGLSAIWFFRDKIDAWLRKKFTPTSVIPPSSLRATDVVLFERILRLLPYEPVGRFLQHQNFAGHFDTREWAGIHAYLSFADSPECRFLDSQLETIRCRMTKNLIQFLDGAHGNIWPGNAEHRIGVPNEWLNEEHPRYGEYWPAVSKLNALARSAHEPYALLVKKGRSKLP